MGAVPQLDSGERRDLFLRVLERARQKYRFVVIGYVVMPEHFHLLITEPGGGKSFCGDESGERAIHEAASPRRHAHGPDLAKAFLRLQCVQYGKAHREATLHRIGTR